VSDGAVCLQRLAPREGVERCAGGLSHSASTWRPNPLGAWGCAR
jgi:hypothetical protein